MVVKSNVSPPFTAKQERSQDYFVFGGWLQGAITAYNMQLDDTFDLAPWQQTETLLFGLVNFCHANPDQRFGRVVNGLMQLLARDRMKASSPLIRATADGTTVLIYESVLRQIQDFLQQKGMLDGAASGTFDEATRAALVAYQKEAAFTENGLPDQPTLLSIMSKVDRPGS